MICEVFSPRGSSRIFLARIYPGGIRPMPARLKPVAGPPHGYDEGGLARIILDLLSNVPMWTSMTFWNAVARVLPGQFKELVAVEHMFGAPGKCVEQVKLDSGEFNGLAVFPDASFPRIQAQTAETQDPFALVSSPDLRRMASIRALSSWRSNGLGT